MTELIPYGRHNISDEDVQSVVKVLRSDFLTQGPAVPSFENNMTHYCGANFGVAVNSATSALHIACLAFGLGDGDILWTSPITFVASANCAIYCGAQVDFVDIDPDSYNMSVESLERKLSEAERIGKLPKIVIPVHLCGQSCDMANIYALSQRYGFRIIEDASHAVGGRYRDEAIGNCRYSDIAVFSFHPVKIITTAEGGMALTNNAELARKMRLLRSHGITRDEGEMTHASEGPWYYQQIDIGYNYRMTDIQAALGMSQLARLNEFVAERHEIANLYDTLLKDLPVSCPWRFPESYSSLHLYVIRLQTGETTNNHRQVFQLLRNAGIGVNLHYIPVYRQPFYKKMGFKQGYCPEAEKYYAQAISLPIFPGLTRKNLEKIVETLRQATQ